MTEADWGAIFRALSSAHRRRLLASLLDRDGRQDALYVPEAVHLRGGTTDGCDLELYHTHLPKLDDWGYVRWDEEADEVARGPRFEEIRPLLELVQSHRDELPDGWLLSAAVRSATVLAATNLLVEAPATLA